MFDSFRDSARIAQTKRDSEGVTAKKAFGALLAAAVVFAVQLKTSDTSAVSRFAYAVVTWLVTYLGWPLAEFGWNCMRAALRIAEGQSMQLQDEKKLFWDAGNAHTFNGRQIGWQRATIV